MPETRGPSCSRDKRFTAIHHGIDVWYARATALAYLSRLSIPEINVKFFVHIVESPSPEDLLDGITEGRALCEAMRLAGIPYSYNLAVNEQTFCYAVDGRVYDAYGEHQVLPILHLSTHGNEQGIALTDNTVIPWHKLKGALKSLTDTMQGGLIICMSSCGGLAASRMAMYENEAPPFLTLVGHPGKTLWADAAVAYISFYHLLAKGTYTIEQCVEAMKYASGDFNFCSYGGAATKQMWVEFMNAQRQQDAANSLQGHVPAPPYPFPFP